MANGVTGRVFEWSVLGKAPNCPMQGYMPYQNAMALVKKLSAGVPVMPIGKAIHSGVCAALGVAATEVRMYSALGTPLDRFHGVDGVVEFRLRVVTIDLTCNSHKDDGKADLLIREEDLDDEEGIRHVAEQIARLLQ